MHEEHKKKQKEITLRMSTTTARALGAIIILGVLGFYFKGVFIAATVNGSPITRFAVVAELEKASGKQALDALVIERLINTEAESKGIVVTDSDVNMQLAKIEEEVKAQGGTLEAVLAQQGRTLDSLKKQITTQKKLEKLVTDDVSVTDAEVAQFFAENKVAVPKGEEAKYNALAKGQLGQQKLSAAEKALIESLKSRSTINIFVQY